MFLFLVIILFIVMLGLIILLVNWFDKKEILINKNYYFELFYKNRVDNLFFIFKDWK